MYSKITIHRAPAFQVGHKNVIGLQLFVIIGAYSGSCSVIKKHNGGSGYLVS